MTKRAAPWCATCNRLESTPRLISVSTRPTASYTAILEPNGELVLGLADMAIYDEITPALLEPALPRLLEYELWFVDANLPAETLRWIAGVSVSPGADCRRRLGRQVAQAHRHPRFRYRPLFLNIAQAASILGVRLPRCVRRRACHVAARARRGGHRRRRGCGRVAEGGGARHAGAARNRCAM